MRCKLSTIIIVAAAAILGAAQAQAVTKDEMEKARTITAQAYLRYANNGSGYLDEIKPSTMSELKGKLKAKEKENLKSFEAVAVPSDYASWDKDKLVEYWSVTFFKSPGLLAEGIKAKSRVASRLKALTIAAPNPAAAEPAPAPQPEATPAPTTPTPAEATPAATAQNPAPEEQTAEPEAAADATETRSDGSSSTWIYVVILCILVAVVVWLVVYAVNTMKGRPAAPAQAAPKQPQSAPAPAPAPEPEPEPEPQYYPRAAAPAPTVSVAPGIDARRLEAEVESWKARYAQREQRVRTLEMEVERLTNELTAARKAAAAAAAQPRQAAQPAPAQQPRYTPRPEARRTTHKIYLGRANQRGVFLSATPEYAPGSSIFLLTTTDGMSGSFTVAPNPETTDMALANPEEILAGACTAHNLPQTDGASEIMTQQAGTALFEGGCWRVSRKARIAYI